VPPTNTEIKAGFGRRERFASKLYPPVEVQDSPNTRFFTVNIYLDKDFQINVISN